LPKCHCEHLLHERGAEWLAGEGRREMMKMFEFES
jgi:hypothetical protein